MAHIAPSYEERQEFWKPAIPLHQEPPPAAEAATQVCQECGTDFVLDSRFCYTCGADRHASTAEAPTGLRTWFDFTSLRDALGQTTASLVALILGCACITASLVTGFLFNAATVLDWQAVQLWRIEWLLAATAIFVAGVLLKKK